MSGGQKKFYFSFKPFGVSASENWKKEDRKKDRKKERDKKENWFVKVFTHTRKRWKPNYPSFISPNSLICSLSSLISWLLNYQFLRDFMMQLCIPVKRQVHTRVRSNIQANPPPGFGGGEVRSKENEGVSKSRHW